MIWETAPELNLNLAKRVKNVRKRRGITQESLSKKSNVSYASIKRFEETGNISLLSLTKICYALEIEDELRSLFTRPTYKDISEVVNYSATSYRASCFIHHC